MVSIHQALEIIFFSKKTKRWLTYNMAEKNHISLDELNSYFPIRQENPLTPHFC